MGCFCAQFQDIFAVHIYMHISIQSFMNCFYLLLSCACAYDLFYSSEFLAVAFSHLLAKVTVLFPLSGLACQVFCYNVSVVAAV